MFVDDATLVAGITQPSTWPVEQIQAVQDGIPVPYIRPSMQWSPDTLYSTQALVQYQGQPFTALRASLGSTPPTNNIATTDWAPLSQSNRIRLMVSGFVSQNMSLAGTYQYQVVPFVEWFDQAGNLIARVFARNAQSGGTPGQPGNMAFDSFTTQSYISSPGSFPTTFPLSNWAASYWGNTTMSGAPDRKSVV